MAQRKSSREKALGKSLRAVQHLCFAGQPRKFPLRKCPQQGSWSSCALGVGMRVWQSRGQRRSWRSLGAEACGQIGLLRLRRLARTMKLAVKIVWTLA